MLRKRDVFKSNQPLILSSGNTLHNYDICYETYGTLNQEKNNAILICHALTGSAHAAAIDKESKSKGWWDSIIGPNKAIDTNRFFVICSNVIGSCKGSTGPASIDPRTEKIYKTNFPIITITDMVNAQYELIKHLEIPCLYAVIGGSMGGMQALSWSIKFPKHVNRCAAIACTSQISPQALSFATVGRYSITSDPNWNNGNYNETNPPLKGLATARMIGHITYLSQESMSKKFGRGLQKKADYGYKFKTDFQIESYLEYQGDKFVQSFDANSYLYLSKALSYFDLEKEYKTLSNAFKKTNCSFLIASISSDWLYPAENSQKMAKTLMKLNKDVTYCNIESPHGHDGFLIESEKLSNIIKPYLER
ncbi:homoserine O-acetyltransferase [Candidatus Marinamargulisbacteria bacterium SCGC AG-410-N11]|nr:homoserine O-acetyltransferase [Candidatus Marinamargulisbacteria bacterium SCGC AG-410-N11]